MLWGVWGVKGVLLTFETIVMYGHFDESRFARYRQIVKSEPKFPVFYIEGENGVMSTKTIT